MPVYEYRCQKGHQYEKAERFGAPREQVCPRCGGPSRRQISLPAVIFKGSGFYSTDNRRVGRPSESGGSDGAKTDTDHDHDQGTAAGDAEKPEAGAV